MGWMRTAAKLLAVTLVTAAGCEVTACVAVSGRNPGGAIEAATAQAGLEVESARDGAAQGARFSPRFLQRERIHPYLGFMRLDDERGLSEPIWAISQPELYETGSPLRSADPMDLIVGVAGGSMADQFARLGGAEDLAPLLAGMTRYEGRRARFISMAGGGLKQPQQLMALEYLLVLGGRMDVVINLDGFNEIALHESENHRHGVSTVYPRTWLLRVDRLNLAELFGHRAHVDELRSRSAQALLSSRFRALGVRQLFWSISDRKLASERAEIDARLREHQGRGSLDFVTTGPTVTDATYDDRLDESVATWCNASRQMALACEGNGIDYFHFLQPNQYVSDSKPIGPEEAKVALRRKHPYGRHVAAGYPKLRGVGSELIESGVRFHDLTGVFADHDEILYRDACCHVNRAGNEVLARAIGAAIASW